MNAAPPTLNRLKTGLKGAFRTPIRHFFSSLHPRRLAERLAAVFLLPCSAVAAPEAFLRFVEADRLLLTHSGSLVWKASGTDFPSGQTRISQTSIHVSPAVVRPGNILKPSGSYTPVVPGGVRAYGSAVAWVDGGGYVYFGTGSWTGAIGAPLPDPDRISRYGQLLWKGGESFVTDETGEFLDQARLWRNWDHAADRELVADKTSGPGATFFRALHWVSRDEVVALLGTGRLVRYVRLHFPPAAPFWLEVVVANQVIATAEDTDMSEARDEENAPRRLVWAYRNGEGTAVLFRSAPINTLMTAGTHLGSFATTAPQPFSRMAVGNGDIFYQVASGLGGPLMRRSARGFQADAEEVATLTHEARELCANDSYVCWIDSGHTVWRLPVGAAAVSRDIAALGVEVIQAIQRPANDVPLVAAKETHVRVLAQIMSSSAGETSLPLSPMAVLYGTRGGVPLPGSPLVPSLVIVPPPPGVPQASPPVLNTPPDRAVDTHGCWFRLPESWTTEGTISLNAVVNPARTFPETSYGNNSLARTATFTPKVPIGLKIIPARTNSRVTTRRDLSREMFDQAAFLLPTSSLRWEFCPHTQISDIFGTPFTFNAGSDDKDLVIMSLWSKKIEGAGGTLAEPGGYDHYMAVIPQRDVPTSLGGYSNPGDTVSSTGSALFVVDLANPGPDGSRGMGAPWRDSYGALGSASVLAHELGHTYGRMHVSGCSSPSFTDPGYPYAGGTISSVAAGHLGFNAFTRRLLPLLGTGDIMTYCPNTWISDYTWSILYHRFSTGYGPALGLSARALRDSGSPEGYTCGVINLATKVSTLRPVYALGTAEKSRALAALPPPGGRYVLRAFQGATLVETWPTGIAGAALDAGDDVADGFVAWAALTDGLTGIDRLELHDQQAAVGTPPMATLTGGGAAPTVTVTQPTAAGVGSGSTLQVQWNSTDDGPGPLVHFVRLSVDNGATWRSLASEVLGTGLAMQRADLPGGAQCRVEVIASDGIRCGRGVSDAFSLPNKAPEAALFFENERRHIPDRLATTVVNYGERLTAHAEVSDLEDGWLPESAIAWTLGTTPPLTGTGRTFQPTGLSPGTYTLDLTAMDSTGQTATASAQVVVRPPFVEESFTPIVIDGQAGEEGWAADRTPKTLRYPGGAAAAQIRFVNDGGMLCLSATGLPTTGQTGERFSLLLDVGSIPPFQPGYSSVWLDIAPDGTSSLVRGMGSAWGDPGAEASPLSVATNGSGGVWNVEARLPSSFFFSGFIGTTVRMAFFHTGALAAGSSAALPGAASPDAPVSWMPVVLGHDWDNPEDLDNDAMPDAWELQIFGPNGSPGGSADSDSDGLPDASEYTAGTSPTDGSSLLALRIQPGDGVPALLWPVAPDRTYTVWRSTDLANFEPVAEGLSSGFSSEQTWTDPAPPPNRAFYRVSATLPR
jgi:hypothetical protein